MNGERKCDLYVKNTVLLSNKEEWNCVICRKMDGTGEYHVKWNKPEGQRCHVLSHMQNLDLKCYMHMCVFIYTHTIHDDCTRGTAGRDERERRGKE
jgi:hypothetical protein